MTMKKTDESSVTRRSFLAGVAGTAGALAVRRTLAARPAEDAYAMVARVDRARILAAAQRYVVDEPVTVTSSRSNSPTPSSDTSRPRTTRTLLPL